jgi:hypothetical protein
MDEATLAALHEAIEVDAVTQRADGSASRLPIWVVVVDGEAYVRSYRAERGAWYQRALASGELGIGLADRTLEFAVERVADEGIDDQVSEAFRAKYAEQSPGPTATMVSPEVARTTLRLRDR